MVLAPCRWPLEARSLMGETDMTGVQYSVMDAVPQEVRAQDKPREEPLEVGCGPLRPWEYAQISPLKYLQFPPCQQLGLMTPVFTLERNFPLGFLADNCQTLNKPRLSLSRRLFLAPTL